MKTNIIDKAIGVFSPKAAAERLRYRAAIMFAQDQIRSYNAAAQGRRTEGWHASGSSANTEISASLVTLRNRARELERNNPYAKRAIQAVTTNTVGIGIMPAPEGGTPRELAKVAAAWKDWAEKTDCDFDGRLDFYGLQSLVMRTIAMGGEALVVRRRRVHKIPIQLQVLEGDFLDHAKNEIDLRGAGGYIMNGVQFDANQKRVGYWLYDRHPAEGMAIESKFVPAADVLHVYDLERPGQVRGVPFGTASMLRLKDFDDYEDAQLIRQKIAACFSVFITDPSADLINGSVESDVAERVEPGMVYHTKPGQDVRFATPPPTDGFADYGRSTLRGIAAGYGPTYEAVSGDLSNVNFSSGRMGWLEFRQLVQHWQNNMLVPTLCNGVFSWFVNALQLGGELAQGAKIIAQWTPPRREMIQPKEEIEALKTQVRCGLKSWQEAVRELGLNPETVLAELAADKKNFDKLGLILEVDASHNLMSNVAGDAEEKPKEKESNKKNNQSDR